MDIEQSFENALDSVIGFLPNLLAFIVILVIGYIVAKIVSAVIRKGATKLGLDNKINSLDTGGYVDKLLPGDGPSAGVAKVVGLFIFAFFVVAAVGALDVASVTEFMNDVLAYIPNVIVALIIFMLASVIAGVAGTSISNAMGDSATGRIAATAVPAIVMVMALFMILDQLQIAESIVEVAFTATVGALALGLALAFGLGGRSVAERILEDAYRKGKEDKDKMSSSTGAAAPTATYSDPAAGSTFENPNQPGTY